MVSTFLLGANIRTARTQDAGPVLADALRKFLFDLNVDDGLAALGYSKDDIPSLVKGTLPQVRFTAWPSCLLNTEPEGTNTQSASDLEAPLTAAKEPTVPKQPGPCAFMFVHKTVAKLKGSFMKTSRCKLPKQLELWKPHPFPHCCCLRSPPIRQCRAISKGPPMLSSTITKIPTVV